ncbi:MAG: hypothetical protein WC219_04835 [Acholeplasmataceae bacterium]
MNIKQQFSQPIDKTDLFQVIRQVLFMSFVGGLLIGALQLLLGLRFELDFTWLMLFILAFVTARRIKGSVYNPHIVFRLLSILAFILSFYIMSVTSYIGVIYLFSDGIELAWIFQALNPIQFFYFLYPFGYGFFKVNNIVNVTFFLIGVIYTFIYSK